MADYDLEKFPDSVGHGAVMAVDEENVALIVFLLGMPCQMDLANLRQRKIGEIVECRSSRDWWPKRKRC